MPVRRALLAGLACAGGALGLVAEQQAYAWSDLRGWLPDLLAGWTLVGLGVALLALRRPRGAAGLLLVAGFFWFAFDFESVGPSFVQLLIGQTAYLHRAPLLQLAVAPPSGSPRTRLAARGIALAWVAALVWPLWENDVTALALAAAFVAIAAVGRARSTGRLSRAIAGRGLAAAAVLGVAIGADAVRSLAGAPHGVTDVTVTLYAAAVALAGVFSFTAAMLEAPATLAEQAVALGRGGAQLRDALRDLLGDPGLDLGYAVAPGVFVDDDNHPLTREPSDRVETPVLVGGREVAFVVHDPATLDDPATRSAILAAAGLAAERARLRAEVTRQVDAVEASRRRLELAEEGERRRLADRLERGPGAELAAVDGLVRDAQRLPGSRDLAAALARAAEQLRRVRPEIDAPLRGLGGFAADALVPALERLVTDLPVEAQLELDDVAVPPDVASALWFVCAESLANAVKHADAHRVRVALTVLDGVVRLSVADDGRGGADVAGSGLAGLEERVGALGGVLHVDSPEGGGTTVVAELPVG